MTIALTLEEEKNSVLVLTPSWHPKISSKHVCKFRRNFCCFLCPLQGFYDAYRLLCGVDWRRVSVECFYSGRGRSRNLGDRPIGKWVSHGDRQQQEQVRIDCQMDSFQAILCFIPHRRNFLQHFLSDILMIEAILLLSCKKLFKCTYLDSHKASNDI